MIINHNMASLNTYNKLSANNANSARSLEKLSSGLRINKAGDDAAGLAISEKMRGQIRGLDQATRNSQDAISMIQTAEGSLNETHSILQRMKELATQAANDTNTSVDRGEIQKEINQLTTEINRIGNTTQFNTKNLLDGSVSIADKYSAYAQGGTALSAVTTILDADTQANVQTTSIGASVEIHDASGAYVLGKDNGTAGALAAGDAFVDVTAANNEFSFKVDGVQYDVNIAVKDYDGAGGAQVSDFMSALQTAINATALNAGDVVVSLDATGEFKLQLGNALIGSSHTLEVAGSGLALAMFGADWNTTGHADKLVSGAGLDANTSFTFDIGAENDVAVTLNVGSYTLAALATELETRINAATTGDDVTVSVQGNKLGIENGTAGATHQIGDFKNAANNTTLQTLGLVAPTITDAQDANHIINFDIDGEGVAVTLTAGNYDRITLASVLQTAINTNSTVAKDVTVEATSGNALKITSGEEGAAGSIAVTDSAGAVTLGLDDSLAPTIDAGSNGTAADLKMQIGANNGQLMSIDISDMRSEALGLAGTAGVVQGAVADAKFTSSNGVGNGTEAATTEAGLDVSDTTKATAAIEVIDQAIATVSSERSKIGAFANRLEHTINNLGTSSENLTAAESRIRDVDMAKEMMQFQKNNILSQAAQAMLAQANQAPQGVLQLLR